MWQRQQVKCQRVAAILLPLNAHAAIRNAAGRSLAPPLRPSHGPPRPSQHAAAAAPLSLSGGSEIRWGAL
jgi:hypothetical protein